MYSRGGKFPTPLPCGTPGIVDQVTGGAAEKPSRSVVCPHCKKRFTAELLHGAAQRHRGFKCPHCKLFVPAERVAQS